MRNLIFGWLARLEGTRIEGIYRWCLQRYGTRDWLTDTFAEWAWKHPGYVRDGITGQVRSLCEGWPYFDRLADFIEVGRSELPHLSRFRVFMIYMQRWQKRILCS